MAQFDSTTPASKPPGHHGIGEPATPPIASPDFAEQSRLTEEFLRLQRLENVGRLASGIAHDLNNILAPIAMASLLLRPLARTSEESEILAMIEHNAHRGSQITRQLVRFGRGSPGQPVLLQPRALLHEIIQIVQETFPKHLQLKYHVPEDLWPVRADPTQVYQVLLNLCINARDAMAKGGTLTISAENLALSGDQAANSPEAKPGSYVTFLVGDTGEGMSPAVMERIFDPFFTTKEPGKGTGLGLSTVLALVKAHGGFMRVQSQPGEGSEFRASLPASPLPDSAPFLISETAPLPPSNGESILVVDDEPAICCITQRVLEANGYKVATACDGAEALYMFSRSVEPFDIVLTDMFMPVLDGASLIRALRRLSSNVSILAMSGLDQEDIARESGLRAGDFLMKPFNADKLLRALARFQRRAPAVIEPDRESSPAGNHTNTEITSPLSK